MSVHPFSPSVIPGWCVCAKLEADAVHGFRPAAVARHSDPDTSWEAAQSVRNIRESQAEILTLFRSHGPMTDEEARERYSGRQSLSGFRTRRSELAHQGLIRPVGKKPGRTGRRMIVWEAA